MDPEIVARGNPVQRGHVYFSTAAERLTAGVWDCTPYDERLAPYPADEFMILLDGSLEIENEDGSTQRFHAGDGFFIPGGAVVAWKQSVQLRKFWVIHDNPNAPPAEPGLRAQALDPNAPIPAVTGLDQAPFESAIPEMGLNPLYRDPSGKFLVGIWDCSPMKRIAAPFNRSELMHIIEGRGTITNGDGVVFEFNAGDTFMVPVGMGYQWESSEYVKKLFCSYTP